MVDDGYAGRLVSLLRERGDAIAVFVALAVALDATRAWSAQDLEVGAPLAHALALALAASLAPHLAEAARPRPGRRALAAIVSTFALVGVVAAIAHALRGWTYPARVLEFDPLATRAWAMRGWWFFSVAGLLFAGFCASRERERATLRALQDAELDRGAAERALLASRLDVLQARVEPAFLFAALARLRQAYRDDPRLATARLDDLIAYLRAALPRMRGGASTLAEEIALASAWLDAAHGRRGDAAIADVDPDMAASPFPPMLLLPLVQACADTPPGALRIVARRAVAAGERRTCAVEIDAGDRGAPAGWAQAHLAPLRARLASFLGPAATLEVERTSATLRARIDWPAPAASRRSPPAGTADAPGVTAPPASPRSARGSAAPTAPPAST